jgi:hypothetical protein
MRIISQRGGKAKALASSALVVFVWGFFLARAILVFAPDSVYVQSFNSDSALPVLMANDERIDSFRTYVYGQDQVGAWPSLICQLVKRATGHVWTPWQIHSMQAAWLFLSIFLVIALTRSYFYLTGALFLLTLCLPSTVSHYFFVLNQRFAWQTTALFLSWWSVRRVCEHQFGVAASSRAKRGSLYLLSFCFAFLAVWTSPSSLPVICFIFALECARARIMWRRRREDTAGRLTPANFAGALPLVAAFAAQQLLRANYRRFALKHFGQDFRTPVEFDRGYLWINLRHQLHNLDDFSWHALIMLGVFASPFVAFQLLRRLGRDAQEQRPDDDGAAQAQLDLGVLLLGSCAVAVINFVTSFAFSWMRLNAYGPRYLALTYMFGTFAGLLTLVWLAVLPQKIYAARRFVFPLLTAACLVLTTLKFPPVAKDPAYQQMSEVAGDLSQKVPPGTPLLGGYWDTYALAALQTDGATIIPVPAEDQLVRTPWTPLRMREAAQVLVVHHVFSSPVGPELVGAYTTFGDGQNPPAMIRQHGATLRLLTPRWHERNGYTFSLYQNQDATGGH